MNKFKRFSLVLSAMLLATLVAFGDAPVNYYDNALGKRDEMLMIALRNIIRNHTEVSYSSGLLAAFAAVDTDDEGYIIDIYSNCRYRPSDNGSSAKNLGQGYNREHSFPRSWFNGAVAPMNTDVFHIYPTDISVNSQRGNHPYGVCAEGTRLTYGKYVAKGKLGKSSYPGYSGTVFEPDDEYKGDLARTFFYMVTCYKNELPSWPGSDQLDYYRNGYKAFSTWTINMLMEWTRLDPVSEKEIKRNDGIYRIQGNRNPFIDHPELAEYIWGSLQGKDWNGTGGDVTASIETPVNGSVIDMGTTAVGTELTYTVNVKGQALTKGLTMSMTDNENFYVSANSFSADEVNNGTSFTVTFMALEEGEFENRITLSSDELSTTFTVRAKAVDGDIPDIILGDSIMEDWEGCTTGGYWTQIVEGHTWTWDFINAGIFADNVSRGNLSCRLGKTSTSSITMREDVEGGIGAISFWIASYGSDTNVTLDVDFSTDKGATWTTLGTVTASPGALQYYMLEIPIEEPVRFRLAQTAGARANIDDITLYKLIYEETLKGDVNGDGVVNISDINVVIGMVLKGENSDNADVNGDHTVNVGDINAIISVILAQ